MARPAARKPRRGLTLLGRMVPGVPKSPRQARIETFTNRHPQRAYWVRLDCPDFTSLCPVTGQPDFARVTIAYIPAQRCLETKSLKLYLASFRNVRAFNEAIANRMLEELVAACAPRRLRVEAQFAPRGGISLTVVAEHPPGGTDSAPRASWIEPDRPPR